MFQSRCVRTAEMIHFVVFVLICFMSLTAVERNLAVQTARENDFVGTWELDLKKSNFGRRERGMTTQYMIRIEAVGEELRIKRTYDYRNSKFDFEDVLFADARGEVNSGIRSKSNWEKRSLVRRFASQKTNFGWMDMREEYRLSADTKTLYYKRTYEGKSPVMPENQLLVFHRKA